MDFFQSLESIGIKFEEQQKKFLLSTENTITLGRSGTGKTTASVFKVLALQLLFVAYAKKKTLNKKKIVLTHKDLETYTGVKIAFATASPVLTNEVRKYYDEMVTKVKKHLKIKDQERIERRKQKEAQKE